VKISGKRKDEAERPEFKVCKDTAEAIITEGSDIPLEEGPSSPARELFHQLHFEQNQTE